VTCARVICPALTAAALLALPLAPAALAKEVRPEGWAVPSTHPRHAKYLGRKLKTVDKLLLVIRGYRGIQDQRRFNTAAVKDTDKRFAFVVWESPKVQVAYVDTDCDGKFETRYRQGEEWPIPGCARAVQN
jgi:hypothetical protein